MGKAQRRKGGDGERELVRLLREHLGEDVTRNLEQVRDGGGDILLPGFTVEVKRAARATLGAWWAQAVEQAGDRLPALAYRLDRQPWRVRLPLAALTDTAGPANDPAWVAEISLEAFAALVRERMPV